ncbi:hypothetical protein GCM10010416_48810 [Streptomyces caniferus]
MSSELEPRSDSVGGTATLSSRGRVPRGLMGRGAPAPGGGRLLTEVAVGGYGARGLGTVT